MILMRKNKHHCNGPPVNTCSRGRLDYESAKRAHINGERLSTHTQHTHTHTHTHTETMNYSLSLF